MLILLKGYMLITFGGAILLFGILMLFPDKMSKDKAAWTPEKIKAARRTGIIACILGAVILVAGFIFHI